MDECENLVNDLETYEEQQQLQLQLQQQQFDLKQQINDNDIEVIQLTALSEDENMGQTESKKSAKKNGGTTSIETKGTAMSFGFRKKLNTTPKKLKKFIEGETKKKQDKCNNISHDGGGGTTGESGGDSGDDKTDTVMNTKNTVIIEAGKDDNGNAELISKVHFEKVGAAAQKTATSTTTTTAATNQGVSTEQMQTQNFPGVGNRFGYRGTNIVRPASTGITPRYQSDMHENVENNNCGNNTGGEGGVNHQPKGLVSNLKRRSKSAHAGRALTSNQSGDEHETQTPKITQPKSITFNLNQNSTIEYQRRQFFQQPTSTPNGRAAAVSTAANQQQHYINTGMHTNVIVRPTPRAPPATYSKFTLHTVSLPKPEFPIAISINATTPTTPGNIYSSSPTTNGMTTIATGARAKSASAAQHPLTVAQTTQHMDLKTAKQMANNTRRGFTGSREISADSGIASMDMAMDSSTSSGGGGRTASPKRSRSRPRNLQMVMNGRHKFEVRDLEDPLSSESSSAVEPLALPKLPTENQTMPLPLLGLVRSNTVLTREAFERKNAAAAATTTATKQMVDLAKSSAKATAQYAMLRNPSEESESFEEEKLHLDRSTSEKSAKFRDINTCSSKTSSPGSSIMLSWCNAGESLAVKDCSSLSISSSEDSNKLQDKLKPEMDKKLQDISLEFNDIDDDVNTDLQISTISSLTEALPSAQTLNANLEKLTEEKPLDTSVTTKSNDCEDMRKPDRPKSFYNALNETKFAEMALAGSTYLLDDETSPTDSLVSSTESEEVGKQKKHKLNEELQEKDIDEISPELDMGSPISPGTPTHASHSLSLSDCGNLIDDEIADQPALLFNADAQDGLESIATSHKEKTDTPTLMETGSLRSLKSQSKARSALQLAMELSLRTPMSLRKAVMERAESLDTLSPCESICSDDLMMDFDMTSSMDSIRSASIKSRSGSDLNKIDIDDTELFSELERKGSDVMKELNTILRVHTNKNAEKDSIIAHLPARATRLLNRSRLQQQCPLTNAAAAVDSDSSKSAHSIRRSTAASRASTASTSNASAGSATSQQQRNQHKRDSHSSSDDLMLYDKSFRNAMIQDVLQFKKQLLRLRRILQETETLNPFENDNGQLFAACGLDSKLLDDIDLASLTSSTTDDPIQELADLRRQVVYLQGQVDDRDRTIRLQRNQIEKLEAEKLIPAKTERTTTATPECINTATQTERTRPLSIGAEGLSRSKPEYTSYTTHFPAICNDATTIIEHKQHYGSCNGSAGVGVGSGVGGCGGGGGVDGSNCNSNGTNQIRRHTIISTTLTNYNQQLTANGSRRASIAWEQQTPTKIIPATYKPVRITLIGEPLKKWHCNDNNNSNNDINVSLNKKNLLNGNVSGNTPTTNGCSVGKLEQPHEAILNDGNDVKRAYQKLESFTTQHHQHQKHHHHQHQHQQLQQQKSQRQQLQQQCYQSQHSHTNGNLNPTVTIV